MNAQLFWLAFSRKASDLANLFCSGEQQNVFASIESMLQDYGFGYCFDITADNHTCCLILTPEGDQNEAQGIDRLVSAAPAIPNWKIFGRRQRKTTDDVRAILKQLYLIDLFQCRFRLATETEPRQIEIFLPGSTDLTPEEQQGFANTLLWHAIGEETVMKDGITSVVKLGIPQSQTTLSAQDFFQKHFNLY